VGEVIEEDFETVEDDVLRGDTEFGEFGDVSNIQEAHVCQRLLALQSSEVIAQLKLA
jgi:hypothetical protein